MSHFFAAFDQNGAPGIAIRKDTRVYYAAQPNNITRNVGNCIGVVWMCNPGSAKSTTSIGNALLQSIPSRHSWGPVAADPTLRKVLALYLSAGQLAQNTSLRQPEPTDYISILNCFYAVGVNVDAAFCDWCASNCSYYETISPSARFILLAWGLKAPHGSVVASVNAIKASSHKDIFWHDPRDPNAVNGISQNLFQLYYPAHPLSKNFTTHFSSLATHLSRHI